MEKTRRSFQWSKGRISSLFMAIGVLAIMLAILGCAHHGVQGSHDSLNTGVRVTSGTSVTGLERLPELLGIEMVSLRTTAEGHMLDLRYRVVNPQAAKEVLKHNSKIDIKIVDPKTGRVLKFADTQMPVGWLRATSYKPRNHRVYFILYNNPDTLIKPGSEVSILFGSVRVDGWKVE